MREYFKISYFRDAILVIVTFIFLFELFYYCRLFVQHAEDDEEIARVMDSIGVPSSDLWVIQHSQLTREIIIKLRENSCKIPILNPFAPAMLEFFKPTKLSCQKKEFYFKSFVQENHDSLVGSVSQSMILMQRKMPLDLQCCYEQLRFTRAYQYKPLNLNTDHCNFFADNKTAIPSDTEYLIIKCWNTSTIGNKESISNSELLKSQPNDFEILFYVPKPSRELLLRKKEKLLERKRADKHRPLNVIILGYDQVSRANFIRLMKKTFSYLRTELDAIDLQGFNKMGDATLNNTLAMLTGHDFGSIKKARYFSESEKFFDECPWIWKNFSEKGYITAYADDYISVFNYRFKGFKKQPTDYYMAPFLQWYQNPGMKRWNKFGTYDCIGNELALSFLQDHAKKVASALGAHPYFHFMWTSRIHERQGYPALADESTLETLKYFQSTGVLNRSLVILTSDHGWRAGPIMMNRQARLENRLSFAFLLLPRWFQEKYSKAYENLRGNQYRLTSPYDIHSTLEDMLNPSGKLSNEVIKKRTIPSGTKGVSLFLPISKNRSCAEAGIDEEWCACTQYEPLAVDSPIATQLANYAVNIINSWLRPYPRCKQYVFKETLSAEVKALGNSELSSPQPVINLKENQQFRISFKVVSGAVFEVTIFTDGEYWQSGNSSRISMSTEVFRLNVYNSAMCMDVYSLKKICTCKR